MKKIILMLVLLMSISGCTEQIVSTPKMGEEQTGVVPQQEMVIVSEPAEGSEMTETKTLTLQPSMPETNEFNMIPEKVKEFSRDVDLTLCKTKTYFTDNGIEDIVDWYDNNYPYTLAYKNVGAPESKPDVVLGTLVEKNGDRGIYLSVQPSLDIPIKTGKNMIMFGDCPWELLRPIVGEPSGELTGGKDVDWSDALVLTDPIGDFWLGGGSPLAIINYPPSDMVKVNVKNDELYLYVKYELNGEIPQLPLTYESDTIRILTYFTLIDKDRNTGTGIKAGYTGADLALDMWFGSPEKAGGQMYSFMQYAFYDPAGEEELGKYNNKGVLIAGGVGSKFVASKFLLSDLGIKKGDLINIYPIIETESDKFHHFARDVYKTEMSWETYQIK